MVDIRGSLRVTCQVSPVAIAVTGLSGVLAGLDAQLKVQPAIGRPGNVIIYLQVGGPICGATHVQSQVELMAVSPNVVAHVADPLCVIVDENVAVTICINEVPGHTALVIRDLPDLSVRNVASSIGGTALVASDCMREPV